MNVQALMVELMIAGFFAVACFRARAVAFPDFGTVTSKSLFGLTGRLERLRRTRWQWCSMVLLLIVVRMQLGTPVVAEFTATAEFLVFLALPAVEPTAGVVRA